MVAASGYDWGWEAWVAIGTIGLAIGTMLLALSTRSTAKATAEDVRAQWRPAIAPAADAEIDYIQDRQLVHAAIQNAGKGAAFQVEVGLDLGRFVIPASLWTPGQTDARNFVILPPGESIEIFFEGMSERPDDCQLIVDCEDLNGYPYSTRIQVRKLPVPDPAARDTWRLVMTSVKIGDRDAAIPWNPPRGRIRAELWRLDGRRRRRQAKRAARRRSAGS